MDTGLDGNNSRKYVDVTSLSSTLGPMVGDVLPDIHAFSGYDYTSVLWGKAK